MKFIVQYADNTISGIFDNKIEAEQIAECFTDSVALWKIKKTIIWGRCADDFDLEPVKYWVDA